MATEAGNKGRYHAAVEFHKLLVKEFDKSVNVREIRFNYFDDHTITYDRAKNLLKAAIIAHDDVLLKKGQCSQYHTCYSRPFSKQFGKRYAAEIPGNITVILDRDKLFSYKPGDRLERALSGRQRWTEPYDPEKDPKHFSIYFTAQNTQIDTLCTGKQIRVISYYEVVIGNYCPLHSTNFIIA